MTSPTSETTALLVRLERSEHRQRCIAFLLVVWLAVGIFLSSRTPAQSQGTDLTSRVVALEAKLAFLTTTGTDMTIKGANLHIVDGLGTTGTRNGLGNLIIGYNEARNDTPNTDLCTGSHNLIFGTRNSFSSWGALVGGIQSTAAAPYACVMSGYGNTASGTNAAVVGGYQNTASGNYACVAGGQGNIAAGVFSSIAGGNTNKALATYAAVSGGANNIANGTDSLVLGGNGNSTTAPYAIVPLDASVTAISSVNTSITNIDGSITGIKASLAAVNTSLSNHTTAITALQTQTANESKLIAAVQAQTQYISAGTDLNGYPATFIRRCNLWVQSGSGYTNDGGKLTHLGNLIVGYNELGNSFADVRTGSHTLVVGQANSYSSYGGAVFGTSNTASAMFGSVTGGSNNAASGSFSAVTGGYGNTAISLSSSVTGGFSNTASGAYAAVSGGSQNAATGNQASVTGGLSNIASSDNSSVSGGFSNWSNWLYSSIMGGVNNSVLSPGTGGAILGGYGNTVKTAYGHFP